MMGLALMGLNLYGCHAFYFYPFFVILLNKFDKILTLADDRTNILVAANSTGCSNSICTK